MRSPRVQSRYTDPLWVPAASPPALQTHSSSSSATSSHPPLLPKPYLRHVQRENRARGLLQRRGRHGRRGTLGWAPLLANGGGSDTDRPSGRASRERLPFPRQSRGAEGEGRAAPPGGRGRAGPGRAVGHRAGGGRDAGRGGGGGPQRDGAAEGGGRRLPRTCKLKTWTGSGILPLTAATSGRPPRLSLRLGFHFRVARRRQTASDR